MYRTSNVARLAGAVSLLALLAVWGLVCLLALGETTATTWALGLAFALPASALSLAGAQSRAVPRAGTAYAVGLVAGVVVLSVSYVGVALAEYAAIRALAGVGPLGLVAGAAGFGLLGGALTLVDVLYVERPVTAALLEERYLDRPTGGD